ncbi:MAG: hypothetical protein J6M66_12375 [Lachnospiraceae bacterium]|nr:hypothetical protein [Lachnospiraceae bacterium]
MEKIVERCENPVVLVPLKQYLESEGIPAQIRYEWTGYRGAHGDAVLLVEEDLYERAKDTLQAIDKPDADSGEVLRDDMGRTYAERKAWLDKLGKYMARGVLIFILIMILYGLIKYPPF